MADPGDPRIDFQNTEIAFSYKSDRELKQAYRLFSFMNHPMLVRMGIMAGKIASKVPMGLADPVIEATIFKQFCGGTSLLNCQRIIDNLHKHKTLTILDYGVEAKEDDEDFQHTLDENLKAIEFAYSNPNVPVISTKLTGFVPMAVLEKLQAGTALTTQEQMQWQRLRERFRKLCEKAHEFGVSIFVDAEESWIQAPLDQLVNEYMAIFNREKPIIYNTFQMYRHDRLDFLKKSHEMAREGNYIFGAKIVRGAYMEKERKRAEEKGYPSPIHPDKAATDSDYNAAVRYTLEHIEGISMVNASHNWESNALQVEIAESKGIARDHPYVNFCQLLGMSDNLTFNLAHRGYNVAKYVPYGPVREVIPYLIRRAEENTSVTGDMGRELKLLHGEMKRRGLIGQ